MRVLLVMFFWYSALMFCFAQVEISPLFTDHALIQQGKPLQVWGTGPVDEIVTVSFQNESKSTKVNDDGQWIIRFKEPQAGGPFVLRMNERVFQDIFVSDLWLAGGQSNMEWKMDQTDGFEFEKKNAIPRMHYFKSPHKLHNKPQWDVQNGEWIVVDSDNLAEVSAVGYFFAKELANETGLPIGILDHSWGGTNIEGWMSPKSFVGFPEIAAEAEYFNAIEIDFEKEEDSMQEWFEKMESADLGTQKGWSKKTDFSAWSDATVPGIWEANGFPDLDGIVYYARNFGKLESTSEKCSIYLGQIDDSDETYFNGIQVGSMENAYNKDRIYSFPASLLKDQNTIVVKIRDNGGGGGFSSAAENVYLQCDQSRIELAGTWKMKIGTENYPPKPQSMGPNSYPSNRYQAMMEPLFKLSMKGMIWYQGESNTGNPEQYGTLFRSMIDDYRMRWNQEFPFLFVQLANYGEESGPEKSSWAILRDQQASVLDLPYTAMATAIDLGEADDIHSRNKKDVGARLAYGALSLVYDKPRPYKNPSLKSFTKSDSTVLLSFDNFGLKLRSKTNEVEGFYVNRLDGSFVPIPASLVNNQVQVTLPEEASTLFYAWSNNPGKLSLYGSYGLPVLPFRLNLE